MRELPDPAQHLAPTLAIAEFRRARPADRGANRPARRAAGIGD